MHRWTSVKSKFLYLMSHFVTNIIGQIICHRQHDCVTFQSVSVPPAFLNQSSSSSSSSLWSSSSSSSLWSSSWYFPVGLCPSCISQPDLTLAVLTWLGWVNSRSVSSSSVSNKYPLLESNSDLFTIQTIFRIVWKLTEHDFHFQFCPLKWKLICNI